MENEITIIIPAYNSNYKMVELIEKFTSIIKILNQGFRYDNINMLENKRNRREHK